MVYNINLLFESWLELIWYTLYYIIIVYIRMRNINILKTPRDTNNMKKQRWNEAYIEEYKITKYTVIY